MTPENEHPIRHIVVVGGGSAGWMTAGLIAARHANGPEPRVSVTLVESPQVATIGVGEGTWPTIRSTLQQIGISEAAFLRECAAAFKQGTRFVDWIDRGEGDSYYHPFTAPAGYPGTDLASLWRGEGGTISFVDAVSAQGMVCDRDLAPKQPQTPEYAGVLNYGYHLDAGRFAALLTRHCTGRLGVRHVQDHVTEIHSTEEGDIASLQTATNGAIPGDLFIDCSGARSMLLGEHFGIPLIDQRNILFNDTALAVQVPYSRPDAPVASQTISTARTAGWIWDIGLTSRRGVGYVYSSRHGSEDEGHRILMDYLRASGAPDDAALRPRKISFAPGYRERFWHRNCVAVGMASGFIEPLEASALVMVELSARLISDELPADRRIMDIASRRFNEKFRYRWSRIIEFLKLHYALSRRTDSDYWHDHRELASNPDRLRELLELWRYRSPNETDFPQVDEIFSAASYQYVLCGMGLDLERATVQQDAGRRAEARRLFDENVRKANQYLSGLPANRSLLDRIAQHGIPAAG